MNSVSHSNLMQSPYLTEECEIRAFIDQIATKNILWLDTEVADYMTAYPRLSLIQVLSNFEDYTVILDVLDKPESIKYFVYKIMADAKIEKVFHNANYDLRFLGKECAKNVSCTLILAKKLAKKSLSVTNLKLKTLASELCHFVNIDQQEQGSNWGRRPLTIKQLQYAKMDTVYLAHVHRRLIEIANSNEPTNNMSGSQSEHSSLSVTNVRVAFECPRLFYLGYRFGGMTLFLPADTAIGIGTAFHDLSNQFVNVAKQDSRFSALFEPVIEQLEVDAIATALQQLFYERVFFPYLQVSIHKEPGKAPALHQLWLGLIELIRRWAKLLVSNRRYCTAKEVISKTFLAQELKVQHYFTLPDGTQQLVKGRCDSIVYDFAAQRLCVVEYKSYQSVDKSAQLAQVALYSYMLRKALGVKINSAVYSVLPNLQELSFTWEQLDTTIHQLVPQKLQQMRQWLAWESPQLNPPPPTSQPYLCHICPQQKKCQTFFDTNEAVAAEHLKSEVLLPHTQDNQQLDSIKLDLEQHKAATPNIERTGEELVDTLQSFGIGVDYQGAAIGPAFVRVKIKPHAGVKVISILHLANDLQVQLGIANPPLITPQAGHISVDLPRQDRQVASFADYIQSQVLPADAPVKIALGVNLEGKLIEADLSDPNTCHFLVGGTTGSGKSEFLRSLLLSLILRHSPDHLKVALVDPKRVTFPEFEQMRSLYSPVVKDTEQAIELMDRLVGEMEQRYQQFESVRCADLSSYNQKTRSIIPRIVCIFDEYADFMAEKESRNALEQSIKRLGAMARAAGIHLIIATQRPEAKVVTPIIRSNLPGRIALRTASEADSAIILGGKQTTATYLLGKGDLLYQSGAQLHRLQSLFAQTIQLP